MAQTDLAFAQNYTSALEIDVTPEAAEPTYMPLATGITSIAPSANESTEDKDYYDGYGVPSTTVQSNQIQYEVEGDRCYGDPAQDFIAGRALMTGDDRVTRFRHTHPNGDVIEGRCTLLNLVPGSAQGEASALGSFTCTIATSGSPTLTAANKLKLPTAVEVTDVTATVGAPTSVTPTRTPTDAHPQGVYGVEDRSVATVDADGNVTGVSAGETQLTVRCAAKPSVLKVVKVTVSAAPGSGDDDSEQLES